MYLYKKLLSLTTVIIRVHYYKALSKLEYIYSWARVYYY